VFENRHTRAIDLNVLLLDANSAIHTVFPYLQDDVHRIEANGRQEIQIEIIDEYFGVEHMLAILAKPRRILRCRILAFATGRPASKNAHSTLKYRGDGCLVGEKPSESTSIFAQMARQSYNLQASVLGQSEDSQGIQRAPSSVVAKSSAGKSVINEKHGMRIYQWITRPSPVGIGSKK